MFLRLFVCFDNVSLWMQKTEMSDSFFFSSKIVTWSWQFERPVKTKPQQQFSRHSSPWSVPHNKWHPRTQKMWCASERARVQTSSRSKRALTRRIPVWNFRRKNEGKEERLRDLFFKWMATFCDWGLRRFYSPRGIWRSKIVLVGY